MTQFIDSEAIVAHVAITRDGQTTNAGFYTEEDAQGAFGRILADWEAEGLDMEREGWTAGTITGTDKRMLEVIVP